MERREQGEYDFNGSLMEAALEGEILGSLVNISSFVFFRLFSLWALYSLRNLPHGAALL
jgi:hypothetical protein